MLLYFDGEAIQTAENLCYDALAPQGWLLLGQSEGIRFKRERWLNHVFPEVIARIFLQNAIVLLKNSYSKRAFVIICMDLHTSS
jgi:hypothetical protein